MRIGINSDRAVQVPILIIRAFTRLREMLATHEELKRKIEAMEEKYDEQFSVVFEAIKQLIDAKDKPKRKIGFEVKESAAAYSKRSKKKSAFRKKITKKIKLLSWTTREKEKVAPLLLGFRLIEVK
jgi:hypothetical protein